MKAPGLTLEELQQQANILTQKQAALTRDFEAFTRNLNVYAAWQVPPPPEPEARIVPEAPPLPAAAPVAPPVAPEALPEIPVVAPAPPVQPVQPRPVPKPKAPAPPPPDPWWETLIPKGQLEKFIGENLLSTIGIVILVIGVAIGVRYAIDKNLISEGARVVLSYLTGAALLAVALRLKPSYHTFSAILMSGAMAILYFSTYVAYDFYHFFSQTLSFALMAAIISATVWTALWYDRQVIAHIGLVGAYCIPFLLSDGSGRIGVMFTYMAITNAGIMAIAEYRDWKALFRATFAMTWLIFWGWYATSYRTDTHFVLALLFQSIYFLTFYAMFLLNRLRQPNPLNSTDILLLLVNSFLYYGIGYTILKDHPQGQHWMGAFTVLNGCVHYGVVIWLSARRFPREDVIQWISSQGLLFLTLAIPVQLDGTWVTQFWAGEAVLLFGLCRWRNLPLYEKWSFVALLIATLSLLQDWLPSFFGGLSQQTPFLNPLFAAFLGLLGAYGAFLALNNHPRFREQLASRMDTVILARHILQIALAVGGYLALLRELKVVFGVREALAQAAYGSSLNTSRVDLLWLWVFSFGWLALLRLVVLRFGGRSPENKTAWQTTLLAFSFLLVLVSMTAGLSISSAYFLSGVHHPGGAIGGWEWLLVRYLLLGWTLFHLGFTWMVQKSEVGQAMPFIWTLVALVTGVSDVLMWSSAAGAAAPDKLALSIFLGVFSLIVMGAGIWSRHRWLRYGAIGLFAFTLLKLFFYDLTHLDALSRTVLFVSLGVLLLIISFLYQKFTRRIFEEEEK